ncbi:hypothetical protein ACFU96_21475 [Streptomyces sp. NPDC057620]|uniref:hypothetical protein n=1 Tax=Streptomyces sp. NPDC057620 TaxID=3346185 RepID=UPI0036ABD83E
MRQDDFFETVDHGQYKSDRLNHQFIDGIRRGVVGGIRDEDVAYAVIYLLIDDLPKDPDHEGMLDNAETGAVIRCFKAVLWRLGIEFELPFHDKWGYSSFRSDNNNGLNTSLTVVFAPVRDALEQRERLHFGGGLRGLRGDLRNLIFAATRKPEIVWRDVAAGTIEITKNKQYCLLYDRPVDASGLTWGQLAEWWRLKDGNYTIPKEALQEALRSRLAGSLNEPERLMLETYWQLAASRGFADAPALLPQVYLHYDPLTQVQRVDRGEGQILARQRMDFLLLAPGGRRYVLELDGKHHYSRENGQAAPELYAEMVREDRRIRLQGYEVYRFGGAEFVNKQEARAMLRTFFAELLGA